MAKIDDVISSLTTKIIELEKREAINVVMRIDEVVAYLEDVRGIANGAKQNQKFDLLETVGTGATVTYKVGNNTITAGADVLKYGDELTITVTPSTGYDIASFTVNGTNAVSGTTITVTENLNIVVTAELKTFNLSETISENCTVAYTVDGYAVEAGTGVLTYGDSLTITVTANTGYEITTFTVNGEAGTSGSAFTVTDDIAVVVTAALQTFNLTETVGDNCTVAYTIGGETVSAGTDVLTYGDTLVTTVTFAEGYVVDTFTINGNNATSPQSTSVTGNVAVVVSAKQAPTEP